MANNYKTCRNGHNFDSKLSECPYCPKTNAETRKMTSDSEKTVVEKVKNFDKTMVEKPTASSGFNVSDNTVVLKAPENISSDKKSQEFRKLIGWLVTFDLSPEGTDFKIREGKASIGRGSKNDIIIPVSEISDEHCILLFRNGKLMINDNLSTNGTFLNGEMIEDKAYVSNDDVITLGRISLKVKLI